MSGTTRALVLATLATLALSAAVQAYGDRAWRSYTADNPLLWVQPAMASRAALGFQSLGADIYWMRAVVYFGERRRAEGERNFDLLYPLLDLVTTLDPRFKVAYRFGAIFLAEARPNGPERPDLAIRLLERGLAQRPDDWEYMHDIAFVHYWSLQDYQGAAAWFTRAAAAPKAPDWLKPLVAMIVAEGGNREASRRMWTEMAQSDEEWISAQANRRLLQLDALDRIDQLNEVLRRFAERRGRVAASWEEVIASEGLPGIPLDPVGEPFVIVPGQPEATVRERSRLWPLPSRENPLRPRS